MVVLVKLGEAIEALPTFAQEDELSIIGDGEEIDLLEWRGRCRRRHGKKTRDLNGQHNTKARARAFATQDFDAPFGLETSQFVVDDAFRWWSASLPDAEGHFLSRGLEADGFFALSLGDGVACDVQVIACS